MNKIPNVVVVGIGAVGVEMIRCLKQRKFPFAKLSIFARTARDTDIDGDTYSIQAIDPKGFEGIDIALFAGTEGEKGAAVTYADEAIKRGAVVIDNGADFRLKDEVPLVVPEVNKESIRGHKGLIANPNCTTIQMVVALAQIQKRFKLEQIILTSFQATSGAGKKASQRLWDETSEIAEANRGKNLDALDKNASGDSDIFAGQIAFNVIPKIGGFSRDNYTSEELKTVDETHKIFADPSIKITSTCVRVPVFTSHCEAVYFKTKKDASLEDISRALKESEGVVFYEDSQSFALPLEAEGKDEVFVGRLRRDSFNKSSFWLWCVSDNLRKGAALNAVQIAENLLVL
ncbi:MAG: aspartate-semialdehyde dehydrogenase [Candidatus Omnitrophica bacterium]|nr:aspartate-semialdehyde dehydrogenase [Candidatus Omnitrophota bacterium]